MKKIILFLAFIVSSLIAISQSTSVKTTVDEQYNKTPAKTATKKTAYKKTSTTTAVHPIGDESLGGLPAGSKANIKTQPPPPPPPFGGESAVALPPGKSKAKTQAAPALKGPSASSITQSSAETPTTQPAAVPATNNTSKKGDENKKPAVSNKNSTKAGKPNKTRPPVKPKSTVKLTPMHKSGKSQHSKPKKHK